MFAKMCPKMLQAFLMRIVFLEPAVSKTSSAVRNLHAHMRADTVVLVSKV